MMLIEDLNPAAHEELSKADLIASGKWLDYETVCSYK